MLSRLRAAFSPKQTQSRAAQIKQYDLAGKPFTHALLSRAASEADEGERWAQGVRSRVLPYRESSDLPDAAASAAILIAYHSTCIALEALGRKPCFYPGDPVPKDTHAIIAFSMFLYVLIQAHLKSEDIKIEVDLMKTSYDMVRLLFLLHSDEEKVKYAVQGVEAFREAALSGNPKVKEWEQTLHKLVQVYVLSYSVTDEQVQKTDWKGLLGNMLSSILSAAQ